MMFTNVVNNFIIYCNTIVYMAFIIGGGWLNMQTIVFLIFRDNILAQSNKCLSSWILLFIKMLILIYGIPQTFHLYNKMSRLIVSNCIERSKDTA